MTPIQRWAASQQGLGAISKAVLNLLASMANRAGTSFPSVKFLAAACSISERSVQRSVAELKTRNLLLVKPRKVASQGQTSNLYCLLAGDAIESLKAAKPSVTGPPVSTDTPAGDQAVTLNKVFTKIRTTNEQNVKGEGQERIDDLAFPADLTLRERESIRVLLKSVDSLTAQLVLDEIGGRMRVQPPVQNRVGYVRALVARSIDGSLVPEHAASEQRRRFGSKKRQEELHAASIAPHNATRPGPAVKAKLQAARAALLAQSRAS